MSFFQKDFFNGAYFQKDFYLKPFFKGDYFSGIGTALPEDTGIITVSDEGADTFTIAWDAVDGALDYTIDVQDTAVSEDGYPKIITALTDTPTGLTASTTYDVSVAANNGNGSSTPATVQATTTA